jgi:hypothetical protein
MRREADRALRLEDKRKSATLTTADSVGTFVARFKNLFSWLPILEPAPQQKPVPVEPTGVTFLDPVVIKGFGRVEQFAGLGLTTPSSRENSLLFDLAENEFYVMKFLWEAGIRFIPEPYVFVQDIPMFHAALKSAHPYRHAIVMAELQNAVTLTRFLGLDDALPLFGHHLPSPTALLELVSTLLFILRDLARLKVVHRDIKPDNIMVKGRRGPCELHSSGISQCDMSFDDVYLSKGRKRICRTVLTFSVISNPS